jgi:hypothetical protein
MNPTKYVSSSPHLKTETDTVSETLCFLVVWHSEWCTNSINPVILSVIQYRESPLDSKRRIVLERATVWQTFCTTSRMHLDLLCRANTSCFNMNFIKVNRKSLDSVGLQVILENKTPQLISKLWMASSESKQHKSHVGRNPWHFLFAWICKEISLQGRLVSGSVQCT